MKKIIFNGIHSSISRDLLKGLLEKMPEISDVVAVCSEPVGFAVPPTSRLFEVNYSSAIQADYSGIELEPLDRSILSQLGNDWFVLLKMLDRMAPGDVFRYDQRMNMLFKHIQFWESMIRKLDTDCFISMNYPHEVFDYVIYALCRSKGIKTLFFTQTQVSGYVQLAESVEDNDPRLESEEDISEAHWSPMLEQHWKQQTEKYVQPFYMVDNAKILERDQAKTAKLMRLVGLFGRILKKIFFFENYAPARVIQSLYLKRNFGRSAESSLFKDYSNRSIDPDLKHRYIYVPLHFQPECTTSPQAGFFVYQELMIEMLLATTPSDVLLYVKEHPMQRIHGRTLEFYATISKNPRVVLVKKTFSSQLLVDSCLAVATATGTAAWEALFKGKRVLLFGYIFFQYAPFVYCIRDTADCKSAIQSILSSDITLEQVRSSLRKFMLKIDRYCIRGCVDPLYEKVSQVSHHENVDHLVTALQSRVGKRT